MDPGMFTKDGLQKPDKFKLPENFQDNRSKDEIAEQNKWATMGGKRRSRRSSKKRKASKKAKKSRRRKSSRKGRK